MFIKTYTKQEGFFDITTRPKTLSIRDHKKIQNAQMFLSQQSKNAEYLKKHEPVRWEKLKQCSAELQGIILSHWSLEEI
jgi:hypothetical protein